MATSLVSPGRTITSAWRRLSGLPGGRALFSAFISRLVPYTGTIRPRVIELGGGHAMIRMRDRRRVRNHLRSVHAIALVNLAEVTSGLAMFSALPDDVRGIVTGLSVDFVKKARGTLTAECRVSLPPVVGQSEHIVSSVVRDESGDTVARATVRWLLDGRARTAAA